ncbi:hypothetical protein M9H77_23447 [Catharanthus roseus]|uniref:Uncharacterized protein n=1 Tax=Catharanthus roseus TaxID=4058 RepID=A0ACC0AVH6_CATRO|nr:hypothetical protein M9H77_23447 [Catharanthus roseus]
MSREAKLHIPDNEGTSGSSHSNLDPMKVIMQVLQQMRKGVMNMRRNMTNLPMEYGGRNNIREYVTSHTQWGYGNFFPYARSYEHNSYDCYRAIDLELEMIIMIDLIREFQGMKLEMKRIM